MGQLLDKESTKSMSDLSKRFFRRGSAGSRASLKKEEQVVVVEDQVEKKVAEETAKKERPQPMVFAVMRNGHEVIRGLMKDMDAAVEAGDVEKVDIVWKELSNWMKHHARMEDGVEGKGKGMFAVLDEKFDKIATNNGLLSSHDHIHEVEHDFVQALESKTMEKIASAWKVYAVDNEKHLEEEEKVMMPKVMEMKKMGTNLKQVLSTEIANTTWDNEDFGPEFVQVAMQVLEEHHGGMPRARIFIHALKAISDQEHWDRWLPFVKAGLSAELYASIDEEIDLSKAGV